MWVVGDPNSVSHASTASSLPTGSSPQLLILSSSRNWIVTGQGKIVLDDLLEAKGTVWKLLTSIRAFLLGSCGSLYQGWEARGMLHTVSSPSHRSESPAAAQLEHMPPPSLFTKICCFWTWFAEISWCMDVCDILPTPCVLMLLFYILLIIFKVAF